MTSLELLPVSRGFAMSQAESVSARNHQGRNDFGVLVVDLFKKVISESFETVAEFEKDIDVLYQSMSRVLLKNHGSNPLAPQRETIQKATSELYHAIVAAKKAKKPVEELFPEIVSSVVFKSFVPMEKLKENLLLLTGHIIPRALLREFPEVRKISAVLEWFTGAYLFAANRSNLDEEFEYRQNCLKRLIGLKPVRPINLDESKKN